MGIEILAPVSRNESLFAAVRCKADAVYLGLPKFNARQKADNFSFDDIISQIEYAHERGVKVYLTLNTLLYDNEFEEALSYVKFACENGVDALIVQDLGLADIIRHAAPQMKLHASTQTSVHTLTGIHELKKLGFSRVVLPRELNFEQIKYLAKHSAIELEVFIHGALCASVSGQCYMSSILGQRSGNRGLCAQPCRLPFYKDDLSHALSLKDLSLIDEIKKLESIGITSVKIEGRMKRAEYTAAAVSACVQSRDSGKVDEQLKENLKAVFSRNGFTKGYFKNNLGKEMLGNRQKSDVILATNKVFSNLKSLYSKEQPLVPVEIAISIKKDNPSSLFIKDNLGNQVNILGAIPEKSKSISLSRERIYEQISRFGGTPFFSTSFNIYLENGLSLPVSALNFLRREAVEKLLNIRKSFYEKTFNEIFVKQLIFLKYCDTISNTTHFPKKLIARFTNYDSIPSNADCLDLIFIPVTTDEDKIKSLLNQGLTVGIEMPRMLFLGENYYIDKLKKIKQLGIKHALCPTLNSLGILKKFNFIIHGGFGLNILNSQSLKVYEDLGFTDAVISFESSLLNTSKIHSYIDKGIIGYGHLPLMLLKNCPGGQICTDCNKNYTIKDRMGNLFSVMCCQGASEIFNPIPLYMADRLNELKNIDYIMLFFTNENKNKASSVINSYLNGSDAPPSITRGLYYKGAV